jgi:hypothetical protein
MRGWGKPMSRNRIEIIAIGNEKVYSVGAIEVSAEGDVYVFNRIEDSGFHLSRHASGETHWISTKPKLFQRIRKGQPIAEFKGIEVLGTTGFGLDSLPELYKEYKIKEYDGIFFIDMRQYKDKAFNMAISILTEEGLSTIVSSSKLLKDRQICIFPECYPMIAITIGNPNTERAKT